MTGLEIGGLLGLGIIGIVGEKVLQLAGYKEYGTFVYVISYISGAILVAKWAVDKFEEAFAWALGSH